MSFGSYASWGMAVHVTSSLCSRCSRVNRIKRLPAASSSTDLKAPLLADEERKREITHQVLRSWRSVGWLHWGLGTYSKAACLVLATGNFLSVSDAVVRLRRPFLWGMLLMRDDGAMVVGMMRARVMLLSLSLPLPDEPPGEGTRTW